MKPKAKKDAKVPKHDVFAPLARKKDRNGAAPTAPMAGKSGHKATGPHSGGKTPDFGAFGGLHDAYKSGINQSSSNSKKGD